VLERTVCGLAAAIVLMLLGCAGIVTAMFSSGGAAADSTGYCPSTLDLTPSSPGGTRALATWPAISPWDSAQVGNAAIIIDTGARLDVAVRGLVIALAVAMQESSLRNDGDLGPANDHDSLGVFQQRPSQGWGTPAQIMNPVHAAAAFYQHLLNVPGWQHLPLTDAAQAVQRSAHPDAYATWEKPADNLLAAITAIDPSAACAAGVAVLARAESWLTAWHGGPVPYLSSGDPNTWFHGYRRDCSGYAPMALGLPGPGLDTRQLAAHSTSITKTDLQPGDLLINPAPGGAGHVVIFDHWANPAMTSYLGYEQSGDSGTHHRQIPYPYFGDYPMTPYHFHTPTR
jgi:cell wall-associated NlpC family hydrolase